MDKNLVSYKALRFTTESNRSSMLYEVKRARAIFDPSLAVPGTSRRGGFRCPVGTRYGGQITDRFGRNCGWGVARRLANEISDLGERLESVGDRRRERKLRKRNDRMAGRLAGAPGAIERAAGRVGDAPDNAADTPARPAREEREDVNLLAAEPTEVLEEMREELENATDGRDSDDYKRVMAELKRRKATRGRRQNNANPRPRPAAAKRPRRNLRASEERRMQREIDNPGAPRTDVDAAPAPAARPRPAAPRRPANAGRRRRPEPANNRDTASRQNEGRPARKPTAVPAGQSDNAARSAEVREREAKPDRTITRDDNAGRLGERERDAKRIRRQMEENPNDDFFANPFNDPAIELSPPVTVLAKLPAKLPAPNKLDAVPNSLFAAPPKFAIGPVIDCPSMPAADLIALTAAAGPANAAAVTTPAICPADSLPVITPACVICVCDVWKFATCEAT